MTSDDPSVARGIQLLGPDGRLTGDSAWPLGTGVEQWREFYRSMVLARRLDTEATALQRQGELGLWANLLGQEAAQVGSAAALESSDMVFPSYREHAVALARGVEPGQLLSLFRCVDFGGWDPLALRFGPYSLVVGAHPLHAVGYAMGIQRDLAHEAVMTYFGDGATSQGDISEAFNFAAVANAPVVFFCQNNGWAISESNRRQFRGTIAARAAGFGFEGIAVDGNDVLAVYEVTRRALDRARDGGGPQLIEAVTYRMGPHTTSDDPTRYRDQSELDAWAKRDPIDRLETLLRAEGVEAEFFASVAKEADGFAAEIRRVCLSLPEPDLPSLFDRVYREPEPALARQKATVIEYLDSFEEQP